MMKFMFVMMFMFFVFNMLNKILIQIYYQNIMFIMFMLFLIEIPLNSNNFWMKIYYMVGCDYYSMMLIMLCLWIFSLMMLVSEKNLFKLNYILYLIIINLMMLLLVFCFLMMNLIMFYIFFESSLIPIFMLIMGWGFQINRIQASFYLMLYTLLGSLPLFIMIIYIYLIEYSLMIDLIEMKLMNFLIYLLMIMAFLIKMPMYFFHMWLPKAHVEAPLVGSMILAGVMLKLGSYGLMRFMIMMPHMSIIYNKFFIIISLMGGIYSSLICLFQIDMKMLVAYSSVVHMSIMMSGLMSFNNWGLIGGLMMMIAHGLCSSGMFCLVNINYERLSSRSLLINKGMINLFPSLSMLWFLLCSSNLSFPPSLNLFSEIMLLNSLISWNFNLIIILMILMFFSAVYSLYLYSYSQHGQLFLFNYYMKSIMMIDYLVLFLHWIPLNLLFIYLFMFI